MQKLGRGCGKSKAAQGHLLVRAAKNQESSIISTILATPCRGFHEGAKFIQLLEDAESKKNTKCGRLPEILTKTNGNWILTYDQIKSKFNTINTTILTGLKNHFQK